MAVLEDQFAILLCAGSHDSGARSTPAFPTHGNMHDAAHITAGLQGGGQMIAFAEATMPPATLPARLCERDHAFASDEADAAGMTLPSRLPGHGHRPTSHQSAATLPTRRQQQPGDLSAPRGMAAARRLADGRLGDGRQTGQRFVLEKLKTHLRAAAVCAAEAWEAGLSLHIEAGYTVGAFRLVV